MIWREVEDCSRSPSQPSRFCYFLIKKKKPYLFPLLCFMSGSIFFPFLLWEKTESIILQDHGNQVIHLPLPFSLYIFWEQLVVEAKYLPISKSLRKPSYETPCHYSTTLDSGTLCQPLCQPGQPPPSCWEYCWIIPCTGASFSRELPFVKCTFIFPDWHNNIPQTR